MSRRKQVLNLCNMHKKSKSYKVVTFEIMDFVTLNVRNLVEIADFKQWVWIEVEKYTCEIGIKSIYSVPEYKKYIQNTLHRGNIVIEYH